MITKECIEDYKLLDQTAKTVRIKEERTDPGGTFYVYDLLDEAGKIIALNRYIMTDSAVKPFIELTDDEKLILNPPVKDIEDIGMV